MNFGIRSEQLKRKEHQPLGEIFRRSLQVVEDNKRRAEQGFLNCIPFGFERLRPFMPGLQKKNYTIVTASSGVGKSKFTKIFYVLKPYEFVKAHPEMGFKFNTFYFCLEESKENFIHSLMCYKLMHDWGLRIPVKQLKSYTGILTDEVVEKIRDMHAFFEEFEDSVTIIDNTRNPFGIYKTMMNFIDQNGTWTTKSIVDKGETKVVRDSWTATHPNHYIQGVVDHISLIHPEKDYSLHESISKLSNDYCLTLRDKHQCAMTIVQQQSADKERQQFTYKGQSIESKLEPSLDGLADNKLTGRDADEVIGLFAPDRYEIQSHRGYDVSTLEDNYRGLLLLKQRDGESNIRAGLFFDGASNTWEELPRSEEFSAHPEIYNTYLSRVGRFNDPRTRSINFG